MKFITDFFENRKRRKLANKIADLQEQAMITAALTWGDITPVIHYSESRPEEQNDPKIKPQAHSDYVIAEFDDYGHNFDVMIEAKHKELALLRYRDIMREKEGRNVA